MLKMMLMIGFNQLTYSIIGQLARQLYNTNNNVIYTEHNPSYIVDCDKGESDQFWNILVVEISVYDHMDSS